MPKIMFFSDPHTGKVLTANTTPSSRQRLRKALAKAPLIEMDLRKPEASVCGGDLLDSYDSGVADLRDAKKIADRCIVVLGGNHDVENSAESFSSLAFIDEIYRNDDSQADSPVVMPAYNEVVTRNVRYRGVNITCVPHHCTQGLFEKALDQIDIGGRSAEKSETKILLLHCNYDCDMATDEISLNLSRARAEKLLVNYDYIMIGHDHNPKTDFEGRLIVMGSIHPTCFGDCHYDHFIYLFNTEGRYFEKRCSWSAEDHYFERTAYEVLGSEVSLENTSVQFARITGEITPEQVPALAKWVKSAWKSENLFALRVDSKVVAERADTAEQVQPTATLSFKERLELRLADSPELLDIWRTVTALEGEGA